MLKERSHEKELLDLGKDYYSPEEYQHCMKMLFRVNKLLGIFYSTVKILKHIPKTATLLDIGCGDGAFILHLSKYFPQMKLKGIDISSDAIQLAEKELCLRKSKQLEKNVTFELQTQSKLELAEKSVDVILITLVCHHVSDEELVDFLKSAVKGSRIMVLINDLHRHSIPLWFFRLFSPLLFRNRLITHDGLISIRRAFIRSEWLALLQKAGIHHYKIKWCFPFRWQVILYNH